MIYSSVKRLKVLNINFGPQHPAAHGVLRLILEIVGERIVYSSKKIVIPVVVLNKKVSAVTLMIRGVTIELDCYDFYHNKVLYNNFFDIASLRLKNIPRKKPRSDFLRYSNLKLSATVSDDKSVYFKEQGFEFLQFEVFFSWFAWSLNLDSEEKKLVNAVLVSYNETVMEGRYIELLAVNKELKKNLSNFQQKKPKVVLLKGSYLYGYLCNGVLKAGDSLANNDGNHNRTNSHAPSVPRLNYGYIIYMNEKNIIQFRELLKDKFVREQKNRDHFLCTVEEAESFVHQYCDLMGWDYVCLSKSELDRYNNSL